MKKKKFRRKLRAWKSLIKFLVCRIGGLGRVEREATQGYFLKRFRRREREWSSSYDFTGQVIVMHGLNFSCIEIENIPKTLPSVYKKSETTS